MFRALLMTCFVSLVFLVSACNEVDSSSSEMMATADRAMIAPEPSSMALKRDNFGDRKIAETHNVSIETFLDDLKPRFERDLEKCIDMGCQITYSNLSSHGYAQINARILPEKLTAYLDGLSEAPGELKEHSVNAQDKTLEYVDTDSKIKNLEALRERLRNLLTSEKTSTVEDILKIETELARIEQQLDSAKAMMARLSEETQKATLNINYQVPYQIVDVNYYEFMNSGQRAWKSMVDNAARSIVFLGALIAWIPVLFILCWTFSIIIKLVFGKKGISLPSFLPFGNKKAENKKPKTKKKSSPATDAGTK